MPCFYVKRVSYSSIHEYFARLSTSQKEKKKVRYLNYSMSNERGFLIYNDFHLLLCNQKQKLFRVTSLSILDQPFMVWVHQNYLLECIWMQFCIERFFIKNWLKYNCTSKSKDFEKMTVKQTLRNLRYIIEDNYNYN